MVTPAAFADRIPVECEKKETKVTLWFMAEQMEAK